MIISYFFLIDKVTPCITYGMRGVVDLEVWISGPLKDLHSGIDGGAVHEPMVDLNGIYMDILWIYVYMYTHTHAHTHTQTHTHTHTQRCWPPYTTAKGG